MLQLYFLLDRGWRVSWPMGKKLPAVAQWVKNLTQLPRGFSFNPWPRSVGYTSGIAARCIIGGRCGSDLVWLWLWDRPAAAARIPFQPRKFMKRKEEEDSSTLKDGKTKTWYLSNVKIGQNSVWNTFLAWNQMCSSVWKFWL